jgi:cyclic pyranopterin phosphate synthase
MVDVSDKSVTAREAAARASVRMSAGAYAAAAAGNLAKGDLLGVARLAGVMAAKRTSELIPLCHPLRLTHVDVDATLDPTLPGVRLHATVRCVDRTGAEMEALTACAVAALTVVDMVKAADPWAIIEGVEVERKAGGRSGARTRPAGT